MYVRLLKSEVLSWNGKNGYPAALVMIWRINSLAVSDGEGPVYGKPDQVLAVTVPVATYIMNNLAPSLTYAPLLGPDNTYGSLEIYGEDGYVVNLKTDNDYIYVVANSERAKIYVRQAADEFGLLVAGD